MTTVPGAVANDTTKGMQSLRDVSAAAAPPRGKRSLEDEFGAMLLLAGIAGLNPLPVERPGRAAQPAGQGQAAAPARPSESSKAGTKAKEGRTASSLAAEALARSQSDELRTVGKGVSLSSLAQAELRGEAAGPAPGLSAAAGEHPQAAGRGASHEAAERPEASQVRAPARATADPAPSQALAAPVASQATVAIGARPAAVDTVRALDRLSSAASRVSGMQVVRGAIASSAPALPGGVTAAKATAPRSGDAPLSQGGVAAPPRGIGTALPESRPGSMRPAHTGKTDEAARPSPASQAQFTAQVHRALGQALQARDGVVTIHLDPEHLGHLRVDLSRGQDGVSARFEAQTAEARGLLERSLPELKAALEARGLHVDRLDVRLTEPPAAERAGHEGEPPARDAGGSHGQDGRQPESGASQDQHRDAPEHSRYGRRDRDRPGAAATHARAEPEAMLNHAAEPAWGVSTFEFVA